MMKRGFVCAGLIMLLGILITPLMMILAFRERGGWGIGGEFAPLVLCLVVALIVLDHHKKKQWREEDEKCEISRKSSSSSRKE